MPKAGGVPWFAVKRHGYGVGLPISWQGWAGMIASVALAALSGLLLPRLAGMVVILLLAAVFLAIARKKTAAPWGWRNGG